MTNRFTRLLAEKGVLLADGATGTTLFAMGLQSGDPPEFWNVDHPERIETLHQLFVDAGSDIVLTNSFGGNSFRLALHKAEHRVGELNEAAARIARGVADRSGRDVIVGGSIGPTGELFEPMGKLTDATAIAAFRAQAESLARGGADVLWIETMSSEQEVACALEGAAATGLPVVCTVSFDTAGRTMMGVTPEGFARFCAEHQPHPDACGTNCGVGAPEVVASILGMARANPEAVLVAKANCGIPEFIDGAIRYNGTPELMGRYAALVRDAGARIIGGCCGTSPEHVKAMREALDSVPAGEPPALETIVRDIGAVTDGARALLSGVGAARSSRARSRRGATQD